MTMPTRRLHEELQNPQHGVRQMSQAELQEALIQGKIDRMWGNVRTAVGVLFLATVAGIGAGFYYSARHGGDLQKSGEVSPESERELDEDAPSEPAPDTTDAFVLPTRPTHSSPVVAE